MASTSWLDNVGRSSVYALAKEEKVELSAKLIRFLEKFGEAVSNASRRKAVAARKAARARQELDEVYDLVQKELHDVRQGLRPSARKEITQFIVLRDVETRLPKVFLSLDSLPTMVVHVDRSYATHQKGCTYGWRSQGRSGARLTGRVGQAANYLREVCKKKDWQLSVSELVRIWVREALEIPLIHRREGSVGAVTGDARRAAVARNDADQAEAGVLFERTPSPPGSRATGSRAGLGSKKRRRAESEVAGAKTRSPASPVKKVGAGKGGGADVRAVKARKTNALGLSDEQMVAFMENRTAKDEVAKRKMQEIREERGLPSPPKRAGGASGTGNGVKAKEEVVGSGGGAVGVGCWTRVGEAGAMIGKVSGENVKDEANAEAGSEEVVGSGGGEGWCEAGGEEFSISFTAAGPVGTGKREGAVHEEMVGSGW